MRFQGEPIVMGHTFKIRQATAADAKRLNELHTRSVTELCKDHDAPELVADWLKHRTPNGYLLGIERGEMVVALEGERIVGFGHAVPSEILAVYVDPERARHGVGGVLLQGITMARSSDQGAIRLDATLNAQGFYEKAGVVEVEPKTVRRNDVFIPVIAMELRGEI
jgi:ribosomal protein S18 acetylase RimI-like enzyme